MRVALDDNCADALTVCRRLLTSEPMMLLLAQLTGVTQLHAAAADEQHETGNGGARARVHR